MVQQKPRWPDFLVIGTAKAGTTSLYHYLKSHPQIYLSPIKEPKYFSHPDTPPVLVPPHRPIQFVWKRADYLRLFEPRTHQLVAGEMSPEYIYSEAAPGAIRRLMPGAKLIAILRDPAERAHSHFSHNRRDGIEPLPDFAAALAAEDLRIAEGWWVSFHYRQRGYYARQLRRYLGLFPREQILVLLYEDLVADACAFLKRICAFLGVDEDHSFNTSRRVNVSFGIPRSGAVRRLMRSRSIAGGVVRNVLPVVAGASSLQWLSRRILAPRPVLQPEVQADLVSGFKPDILKLQEIVGRDLSSWLRC